MSFSVDIKNEICMFKNNSLETVSELSGFIRNNYVIENKNLLLITENPKIARRIYCLIKDRFNITPTIKHKDNYIFNKKKLYIVEISDKADDLLEEIYFFSNNKKKLSRANDILIDAEDTKRAYLRGTFLANGSINDPKTARYHLEMLFNNKEEAKFVQKLLLYFDLPSKILLHDKKYMLYMKEAEKIADFLRVISANSAVLYYEDIRIYRDHKNMTNRLNNCEQANVDKTIHASTKQINDIKLIKENVDFDLLDEKLQIAIIYREKYPDLSFSELSEVISLETNKKITKSGLSHRLKKISELANKFKSN